MKSQSSGCIGLLAVICRLTSFDGRLFAVLLFAGLLLVAGCKKQQAAPQPAGAEVTVMTVSQQDTPVDFEFTAQTQSSREVEIRARIDGFLDKRTYIEGQMVQTGQTLFLMDRKPFEAALQTAKGELALQQARLTVARANLARVRPLAKYNALSQKDLDDAIGNDQQAGAAVVSAQGKVQTAELNLSYTVIKSPLRGLSSFARQQDGSYVTATGSGLLTYVYQVDPMWVNFSVSENELLQYRNEVARKQLRFPPNNDFTVTLILADGSIYPEQGHIDFTNPAFSSSTGTFLVRASFGNPDGTLRPNQFVRARVSGAIRPNAVLVPQRAVLQGSKSHYVWTVDKDSKAHQQVVEVGEWHGDNWFIQEGLRAGDRVVVDGAVRVVGDAPVKIIGTVGAKPAAASAADASTSPAVKQPATPERTALREGGTGAQRGGPSR
ncbi:MAG TPA: efflux RND transporter periplasmic adaptor subunit [Trinickia sp.]|uniref:efflux RND transporter periplasmic adaptor subunit n=1 Tax=Trinickia sp. TaxID=2571163 RepID=UPI002C5276A9|nr:efflux RND transporter periplasmic adaptor subunit [Trinickia sp.]HTI19260.1 efflux RND transporter periplasmic adaptor subunit [Trinickia sp.]